MDMRKCCEKTDSNEAIREKAKELWQKDGCKQGHDLDYWLQAEKLLKGRVRR